MIVDDLRAREKDLGVERSARVRWEGGEMRLSVTVPPKLAGDPADASPFATAALLPAMCRHEDLEVDGPVSPRLVAGLHEARDLYARWSPPLHPAAIRVAEERAPAAGGTGHGCFFSRGVDSTYSAAVPRPDPLTELVYCDGLEPRHDDRVREREVDLADEAAGVLELPLAVVRTNVRELTDPVSQDWEDAAGAGLGFVAAALAGGMRRMTVPATNSLVALGPCGTSPFLDPLFSTEAVEVVHDSNVPSRNEKVAWLAEHRRESLGLMKVCYAENRSDNCGRCPKCLRTMAALEAAGALGVADCFPDRIDPEALRGTFLRGMESRLAWLESARALPEGEAKAAMLQALREAEPPPDLSAPLPIPGFKARHRAVLASALLGGGRRRGPLARLLRSAR